MKYRAIALTSKKMDMIGFTDEFSQSAISALAETAVGCPVFIDFDENKRVGFVSAAHNNNGCFEIEVDINYTPTEKERIVPCYIVDKDEWSELARLPHRIVNNARSVSFGITTQPVEKDLPEMELLGDFDHSETRFKFYRDRKMKEIIRKHKVPFLKIAIK